MSSTTPAVLHRYQLKDHSTSHASNRKSMRIGTLINGGQSYWVSFDKRGDGDQARYWNDAGDLLSHRNEKGNIEYAEGLQLSRFGTLKAAKKQTPQWKKQKLLINKIYHQDGVQFEGDLEIIEAVQAVKDEKQGSNRKKSKLSSGKTKNTTPRKTQKTAHDSDTILDQFRVNASALPATFQFAKKLQAIMRKQMGVTPPERVLLAALEEAHKEGNEDASRTRPWIKWTAGSANNANVSVDGGDEGSDDSCEEEEESETDDDEEGDERKEEQKFEQEKSEDETDSGTGGKNNDSHEIDDGNDGGHESDDDDDLGVGTLGPSDQLPSPTASGVSTQSNQPLQGSSGPEVPGKRHIWAHELLLQRFPPKFPRKP